MHLKTLGQEIGGGLVIGLVGHREHGAGGPRHRLVARHQLLKHAGSIGNAGFLGDHGQLRVLGVAAGSGEAQGPNPLGDIVDRHAQFRVLGHEHGVKRIELRPGHVPVEIVGLEVQGVGVGQDFAQTISDRAPICFRNADIDFHRWILSSDPWARPRATPLRVLTIPRLSRRRKGFI